MAAPGRPRRSVETCQTQVMYLTQRSMAAAHIGESEHKREMDYALALAYAQLGEALLAEHDLVQQDNEGLAESAMSCFSDAATLFHALGAEDEKEHALRRARRAHELYCR